MADKNNCPPYRVEVRRGSVSSHRAGEAALRLVFAAAVPSPSAKREQAACRAASWHKMRYERSFPPASTGNSFPAFAHRICIPGTDLPANPFVRRRVCQTVPLVEVDQVNYHLVRPKLCG